MKKNYPQIGQKLIIIINDINGEKVEYISQLMDIEKNADFAIAVPIKNSQLVTLLNGSKISIIYYNNESGMFEFEAEVIRKTNSKIPLMFIRKTSEIIKGQRRNYFRLDVNIPINIIKVNDISIHSAMTKDISGGGLRVSTSMDVKKGDILQLSFEIEKRKYNVQGIVRAKIKENKDKNEVGIEFLDIIEIDRNDLIKYLFLQQRMLIKRGM